MRRTLKRDRRYFTRRLIGRLFGAGHEGEKRGREPREIHNKTRRPLAMMEEPGKRPSLR